MDQSSPFAGLVSNGSVLSLVFSCKFVGLTAKDTSPILTVKILIRLKPQVVIFSRIARLIVVKAGWVFDDYFAADFHFAPFSKRSTTSQNKNFIQSLSPTKLGSCICFFSFKAFAINACCVMLWSPVGVK
jgi:hypothetical protein